MFVIPSAPQPGTWPLARRQPAPSGNWTSVLSCEPYHSRFTPAKQPVKRWRWAERGWHLDSFW